MGAFEDQMLAVLPRLRRFARALSRNTTDADDLAQAAVEKALKAREQWAPGTRMDSWMYRIVRNTWIDTARSQARAAQTFLPEEAGTAVAGDDERAIEAHIGVAELQAAIQTLPAEQREAVALVLVEGLAYKEAAKILDVPMGTLTSRLVRGRQALIARLGEPA